LKVYTPGLGLSVPPLAGVEVRTNWYVETGGAVTIKAKLEYLVKGEEETTTVTP
jgi:hypothetical protein